MLKRGLAALALLLTLAMAKAVAGNEQVYVVAFPEGDYYPHYDSSGDGMRGFLPDLMQRFANEHGYQFVMRGLPIKRYQSFLQTGEVDFILPSNPAWTDSELGPLTFSDQVMNSRAGFFRLPEDLHQTIRAIAIVRGYRMPTIPAEFLEGPPVIHETVDTEASLGMLRAGRVDAAYAHLDFAHQWARKTGSLALLVLEDHAGVDSFDYHLATKNHPDLIDQFNQWLKQSQAEISGLQKKYGINSDLPLEPRARPGSLAH